MIIKLLICLANVMLVFSFYKDEALVNWPFCNFKEDNFEQVHQHLYLAQKPYLHCGILFYEWETDNAPVFEDMESSEMIIILDVDEEDFRVPGVFWSTGRIARHGAVWSVIAHGVKETEISKYELRFFSNSYVGIEGLFFKSKHPKDESLVWISSSGQFRQIPRHIHLSEKSFLVLWDEHIKGQVLNMCHEPSDDENEL